LKPSLMAYNTSFPMLGFSVPNGVCVVMSKVNYLPDRP
jgi:hypothetical protein